MRGGIAPALVLFLAFVSGAAGLAHQILWVRRMVDVLGADSGTFSRVIGAFFLGLAAGAWLAAKRPASRPWRGVALAEFAVAGLALLMLGAGQWAHVVQMSPAMGRVLTWILPLVLVTPPALAMGFVIPWMIRAGDVRLTVPLYAVNTLGSIIGLVLMLAWALPTFGLTGASLIAAALNAAVGVAAWSIDSRAAPPVLAAVRSEVGGKLSLLAVAFASGFLVLGAEVILQHQLAQFFISSHFSSGIVLTLVLAALGVAALLAPLFARIGTHAVSVALVLAVLASAAQPLVLVVQRGGVRPLAFEQSLGAYLTEACQLGVPGVALLLLPAGLIFPLLLHRATALGIDAGRLLAVNGLGGWLGAELTERILAPRFGLWYSMAVFAAGYVACLVVQKGWLRWVIIPPLAGGILWSWKIDARLPYVDLNTGDRMTAVKVGREGVVAVIEGEPDDRRIRLNNTYTLGGSRAQVNQERQALLPMLLHGDARRVGTLGVATGSTLAGATLDPAMESVEGIELSPLVLGFAREWFAPFNRHVAADPRVRLTLGDARWVAGQRRAAFDVIVGDLFLPWSTGEGRLFTREHFTSIRAALRPDGLYCQWLPMYQLTRPQFDAIVRTFREVFPEAWLVRGDFYTTTTIVGLIGGRALGQIDWEKTAASCERLRQGSACRDPLVRHVEGVAMCVVGPAPAPPPGPAITLANGWLEWDAAHNVFGLREPWFVGVPLGNYLRAALREYLPRFPEHLRRAQGAGDFCLALEIAHTAKLREAAGLDAAVRRELPAALLADPVADWTRWPMRHRPALP